MSFSVIVETLYIGLADEHSSHWVLCSTFLSRGKDLHLCQTLGTPLLWRKVLRPYVPEKLLAE